MSRQCRGKSIGLRHQISIEVELSLRREARCTGKKDAQRKGRSFKVPLTNIKNKWGQKSETQIKYRLLIRLCAHRKLHSRAMIPSYVFFIFFYLATQQSENDVACHNVQSNSVYTATEAPGQEWSPSFPYVAYARMCVKNMQRCWKWALCDVTKIPESSLMFMTTPSFCTLSLVQHLLSDFF